MIGWLGGSMPVMAQLDSLNKELRLIKGSKKTFANDSLRVTILLQITGFYYQQNKGDSCIHFAKRALEISEEMPWPLGTALAYFRIGNAYFNTADYPQALANNIRSLRAYEQAKDTFGIAKLLNSLGGLYHQDENYPQALAHFTRAIDLMQKTGHWKSTSAPLTGIAEIYKLQKNYPLAIEYNLKALAIREKTGHKLGIAVSKHNLGEIYVLMNKAKKGLAYLFDGLAIDQQLGTPQDLAIDYHMIGRGYLQLGQLDSAIWYAQKSLTIGTQVHARSEVQNAAELLYLCHKAQNNTAEALRFHELYTCYKDSIFNQANLDQIKELEREFRLTNQQLKIEKINAINEKQQVLQKIVIAFLCLLVLATSLGVLYWRNLNKLKQMAHDQKMAEIAYLNSHETRAPLATLLGLLQLYDREDPSNAENQVIISYIDTVARKLDEVIRRINDKTY